MFRGANKFNQDIGRWRSIESMDMMFKTLQVIIVTLKIGILVQM
jgi:hypothetical protein